MQSQAGQGGGARATAGQVNNARTAASGTPNGTIATNVQNLVNQTVNTNNQINAVSSLNQTIQTTTNQTRIEQQSRTGPSSPQEPQTLVGFTGGLVFSRNNYGPFGPVIAAIGAALVETNAQNGNDLAAFGTYAAGHIGSGSYNPYAS